MINIYLETSQRIAISNIVSFINTVKKENIYIALVIKAQRILCSDLMPKSSPCLMEFIKFFLLNVSGSTTNNFEAKAAIKTKEKKKLHKLKKKILKYFKIQ